ncbi:aspartyl/asparaginyl beta-hydroxylase domain-containing protein [Paraburkholderia youngii]|uniref:aspartyl/asparaginyl beta-hydroxylase domain-containing protein n=1 Tax=Paraburkholderia youngii TaxID=2782701 RepID=UPI001591005E|nr:aspartyl/asparaginyl beta-hydroxylase domain-containing protein [Paraburkholderia youngii]
MNFERLLTGLPVAPLAAALADSPEWWQRITTRQDFLGSPHEGTETIFLRGPLDFTLEEYFGETYAADYPELAAVIDELMPIVRPLLQAIEWKELGRMLLVRMPPGVALDEHTDEGAYAEHYSRFHIPLATNGQCELVVNGQPQHMQAGEAWWFNHRAPHSAHNMGETERVHLIVDAVSPMFRPKSP